MPRIMKKRNHGTFALSALDFDISTQYSENKKHKNLPLLRNASLTLVSHDYFSGLDSLLIPHISDLAVHKKKVDQVMQWITSVETTKHRVMIITGPSGCGKTTVVRSLCSHFSITIKELSFEDIALILTNESMNSHKEKNYQEQSVNQLHNFPSLLHSTDSPIIFLLKDVPLHTKSHRTSLFNLLSKQSMSDVYNFRWIFIITDGSGLNSLEMTQAIPMDSSFPGINVIRFNPIAPTLMKKALLSKYTSNSGELFKSCLEQAIIQSHGDLRAAILYLQWHLIPCDMKPLIDNSLNHSNIPQPFILPLILENTMYNKKERLNMCELTTLFSKASSFHDPEWLTMCIFNRYLQYLPFKDNDGTTMTETWRLAESFSIKDMLNYKAKKSYNELPIEIYCMPIRSLQLRSGFSVPQSGLKRHYDGNDFDETLSNTL